MNAIRNFLALSLVAVVSLGFAAKSQADLIKVDVNGVVGSVDPDLSSGFAANDPFSLSFTYDSDTLPLGFSNNLFAVFNALTSVEFTAGSYSGSSAAAAEVQIDNDPGFGFHDRFAILSRTSEGLTGADVNNYTLDSFSFRLDDSTDAVFSTALVLPTSLELADFDSSAFFITFSSGDGFAPIVSGRITSLTTSEVPEPASVLLLSLGAIGIGALRRRN